MSLEKLPKPAEFLELMNTQSFQISPLDYDEGLMTITPKPPNPQIPKEIVVLRLYYDKDPTLAGLDYVDISSQTLIAQLSPMIDSIIRDKRTVKITAFGEGVKKRFTVQVI